MKMHGAALVAAAMAAAVIAPPALAAGHANRKQDFVTVNHRGARTSMYVQRSRHTSARAAACSAGSGAGVYCTPPVEQNLFGAYTWSTGTTTFGSNSSTVCKSLGYPSTAKTCGVYTTVANTLIAVFTGASGTGQSVTVSCKTSTGGACPVTFHKVVAENAGGGDSEVWYADATNVIAQTAPIFVTATDADADCGLGRSACDVSLQAITFTNAITFGASGPQGTGIGASSVCFSVKAAPSCSLTTMFPDSIVWGALNNPSAATIPTWPSNQFAVGVADSSSGKTFYSQFLGTCTSNANGSKPCTTMPLPPYGLYQNPFVLNPTITPLASTKVTINDTAPTTNAFNEALVEIL
jgi:hypothetical protein